LPDATDRVRRALYWPEPKGSQELNDAVSDLLAEQGPERCAETIRGLCADLPAGLVGSYLSRALVALGGDRRRESETLASITEILDRLAVLVAQQEHTVEARARELASADIAAAHQVANARVEAAEANLADLQRKLGDQNHG